MKEQNKILPISAEEILRNCITEVDGNIDDEEWNDMISDPDNKEFPITIKAMEIYASQFKSSLQPTIECALSKYSNSEIGSHHWAATLLSFVMRVGEYLESHKTSTAEDQYYANWGTLLKERAVEINDYLHSLPDKPIQPISESQKDQGTGRGFEKD